MSDKQKQVMHDYAMLFDKVSKVIAPGDGMLKTGTEAHYYSVGASAISAIRQSLDAARIDENNINRILDYACGYGRVLRWLKAAFPHSQIIGVDANPKAVVGASFAIDVETKHLDIKLEEKLGDTYDLIWIGSLITHLPRDEVVRVISYIKLHLNKNGLLVFTTHGELVEKRIESRVRTYGLSEDDIPSLLEMLNAEGYGFKEYPGMKGYGISVSRTSEVLSIIEDCGMEPILFKSRGWADHQDVFACIPRLDLK